MRAALLVAALACACSKRAEANLPAPPGARRVCTEGSGSVYATAAPPSEVARFYGAHFGERGARPEMAHDGATTRLRGADGEVTIYASGFGALPPCVVELAADTRTIVELSVTR